MSENVKNFINSVQQKDYTAAKDMFQGAMAEKISAAFENKKIELASQMTEGTQSNLADYSDLKEQLMESLDMDPKKLAKLVDGMASDLVKNNVDAAIKKLDSMINDNKEKADFLKLIVPNLDVSRDAERQLKDKMKEYSRG